MLLSIRACMLASTILLLGCSSHNTAYLTKIDFRGVKLGSSMQQDMQPSSLDFFPESLVRSMHIPNEDLSIGDIEIKSVNYEYFQDQLYKIFIDVGEDATCMKAMRLKDAFSVRYGRDFSFTSFEDIGVAWRSNTQLSRIHISCQLPLVNGDGTRTTMIFMTDTKLEAQAKSYLELQNQMRSENRARELAESF